VVADSGRAYAFATQLIRSDPAAFELAETLDDDDRAALASLVRDWLRGARAGNHARLLSFIAHDSWPEIATIAASLAEDSESRVRGIAVLDEAALQAPHALAPHLAALSEKIEPQRLRSWERECSTPRLATHHLAFARDERPYRSPHPTQGPPAPASPTLRFGGTSDGVCGLCHERLRHLITLEPDRGPVVMGRIEIATCLSCLGWEQPHGDYALSFRHDANGAPTAIERIAHPLTPQFPAPPLRELRVVPFDAGARFWAQRWGGVDRNQNLNRLGGRATWIQGEEQRRCAACVLPMHFLLQLDSGLPQGDKGGFDWGSGGVLFVLWCGSCAITTMFWQCT